MTTSNDRSGGPMATTVDRVIVEHHHGVRLEKLNCDGSIAIMKASELDAAIRRAAVLAMEEMRQKQSLSTGEATDIIERHIRAELGL